MLARKCASSARTAENLNRAATPASALNALPKDASATAVLRTTAVRPLAKAARTVLLAVSRASAP
jgi:hypothetical protein